MSQQPMSNRILAGAVTFIGLGIVWIAILNNLPSQQELSAKESPQSAAQTAPTRPVSEPVLDLSIPGVPASPSTDTTASVTMAESPSSPAAALDPRTAQVARLRCEAEIEQLCPEATDGLGRRQCLEKHGQRLPVPCQQQVRERLVKWKEERSRITLACQADIRRFCRDAGTGRQLQCLQQHAQELSDGCYETLPKGALYFKQ